ncbi:MAG TPA: hypothetical protein VI643_00375, partial [Planctomycetota bacterium]|nr:hypothetical protein [Planctomycetota bacterium]
VIPNPTRHTQEHTGIPRLIQGGKFVSLPEMFFAKIPASISALLLFGSALAAQDQQMGARTKGMGGSYTAFEDDPVSVWLNPAGIATQPDQFAIMYQSYTGYALEIRPASFNVGAQTTMVDPPVLPGYVGMVFQIGSDESPAALGIAYARPYHLKYSFLNFSNLPEISQTMIEQSFARFRVAFAKDLAFRPAGEAGFFTHISIGIGLDVAHEEWDLTGFEDVLNDPGPPPPPSPTTTVTFTLSDNSTTLGYGAGILIGLYDNRHSFKVNLGAAFQSKAKYSFNIDRAFFPAFDMPQQINAGVTIYLLEGTPLRITMDAQWIEWNKTAEPPSPFLAGAQEFENVVNYSVGAEYRFKVTDTAFLYVRGGGRRFDPPWKDVNNLPVTGAFLLFIDTEDDKFKIYTAGLGVSWVTEGGKVQSIDVGGDWGGDAFNIAIGYTREM